MKKYLCIFCSFLLMVFMAGCKDPDNGCDVGLPAPEKPIIYLYPEKETLVELKLDFEGILTHTYPSYNDGWSVLAQPDGTLIDPETGRSYYGLFWEGETDTPWDMSSGFVVEGKNTAAFLEDTLAKLGLTEREANEFIIYWLPRMENNPYNLISFQQEDYTDAAVLQVIPQPDTMIRVFMVFQALDAPIEVKPQDLTAPERTGFVLVEWGGLELS